MIPFRRASSRYGVTPAPETPYQRAGQAWDERLGSARVQARNWRWMAFGCLLLAGAAGGGWAWQASRSAVTPWIVQLDRLGRVAQVAPASAGYRPTDGEVAWQLARFVEDVRSVPADPVVLRQAWLRAYGFVAGEGAAALNDSARRDDPFGRLGREQVTVEVSSLVRASPGSFRAEWTEHSYAGGVLTGSARWTAILTVDLRPPRDADALRRNPLGVFVTNIAWSKELS